MKRVLLAVAALAIAACNGETTAPSATAPALKTDLVSAAAVFGSAAYNNIPSSLPPNVPSQGFQCCATAEFGDYVRLSGTARIAGSVTVLMSDWAMHSTYPAMDAAGYTHPITLNIYNVDNSGSVPALGTLISSVTQTFTIPWRPEADATCADGTQWKASNGQCYSGVAFKITFDLHSLALTLPSDIILGIAYNTNTWGYVPIHQSGPYESLNVGLATVPPTIGTDVEPNAVFWNTSYGPFYTDGGSGGVGTFRRDTNWSPYSPGFSITTFYPIATTINGCKNNGWRSLSRADGTTFKNQKECTNYVSGL